MAKEYIFLNGQKYEARDMVESLLESIRLHQEAIRKIVGETSMNYEKLATPFVTSNLNSIISCVEDLKEIQEQLKE